MQTAIRCKINGEQRTIEADNCMTALDVLRDILFLTGTKKSCETGDCGACTIIWNGKAVNSCLMPASRLEGAEVTTVEGLMSVEGDLDPIQEAFIEAGASQCGFCTPGFVVRTKTLLKENPSPTREQIAEGLVGNICRCTGYKDIIDAVEIAAQDPRVIKTS